MPWPGAVRQAGCRIARPETGAVNDGAGGDVDILAAVAGLGGGEARGLRRFLQVPDVALAPGRFAEDVGARDIGEIAIDRRAGIDQDHVAVLERLRIGHAVRIRRRLAEQHRVERRIAFRTELAVRGGDEGLHFGGGDTFAHDAGRGLVRFERDVLGGLHQREFVLGLDHAATGGDVDRVDEGVGVAGAAQAVEREKRRGLVDGDGAAGIAERAHGFGDGCGRILVLLPDGDLVAERDHGPEFLDLECRRDIDDLAFGWQNRAVHAFGAAELQSCEIGHARGDIEIERVDALLAHDRLGAGDAPQPLIDADRWHFAAHVLHGGEFRLRRRSADANRHHKPLSIVIAGTGAVPGYLPSPSAPALPPSGRTRRTRRTASC
jgi:hypothetical protein